MADSMPDPRDFEKPLLEIDRRIADLEGVQRKAGVDMSGEVAKLKEEWERTARDIFSKITPWQRVQLARDQGRPEATDYLQMIVGISSSSTATRRSATIPRSSPASAGSAAGA